MTAIALDLVIIIDTSPSVKNEAQGLNQAAATAIANARSSCPSDLRIIWLGIEGIWKNTQFNRTVREYLTTNCSIPESALKSRKKGELADGGAQEDAARAIQDIATHFDWREGVAKAIFYLGDEALEGGGAKTEQKDIEGANLAIQIAKTTQVKVHTYFGQSKSRYRQTIESEYARVAKETGGQAFRAEDSLSDFGSILEKVICSSQSSPKPPSPEAPKPKSTHILATGLEDYGRWKSIYDKHERDPNEKPFRRGRIWC